MACDCHVVNIRKHLVVELQEMNCQVQSKQIPSHIGIRHHNVADELGKQATEKIRTH